MKHKIPVKPIFATVRNLHSVVSGKVCRWRVLGMMPSLQKSATLAQTDRWRGDRRLRLHHACIAHVVEMVNGCCSEDETSHVVEMVNNISRCWDGEQVW